MLFVQPVTSECMSNGSGGVTSTVKCTSAVLLTFPARSCAVMLQSYEPSASVYVFVCGLAVSYSHASSFIFHHKSSASALSAPPDARAVKSTEDDELYSSAAGTTTDTAGMPVSRITVTVRLTLRPSESRNTSVYSFFPSVSSSPQLKRPAVTSTGTPFTVSTASRTFPVLPVIVHNAFCVYMPPSGSSTTRTGFPAALQISFTQYAFVPFPSRSSTVTR